MVTVPFPPFEPDKSRYNSSALPSVNNVVPTSDGWRPLAAIVPTPAIYMYLTYDNGDRITYDNGDPIIIALDWSDITGVLTLPGACTGLFAAKKKDGTEVLFAGTETSLYRLNKEQLVWDDVSSMTYASAVRWSFEQFGSVVYAQNGFDPEQMFDVETDTVFSDNATAPICKYLRVIGPFLFRFNIVSWAAESITDEPGMFMCSAHEDPTDNVPQDSNWCDYQAVPVGGEIVGAIAVSGGAHIWLKGGVVPMSIPMGQFTFELGDVDTTRGSSAPYSIGVFGMDRYTIYCDDGWWLYNGSFSPIGQDRINRTFLAACDQDTFGDILASPDPENAVIWMSYTNNDGQRRMFGYQYNLDRFTASDIEVTASCVARTFIYAESDPPILKANQPRFMIVDENGQMGYLVGASLAARITTNEIRFSEDRAFANLVQLNGDPLVFTVTSVTRDINGGPSRSRTAATPSSRSGNVPIRASGRSLQLQLDIVEAEGWTNVSGLEVAVKKAGRT